METIYDQVKNNVGVKPTYNQFFNAYLEAFRINHPNSTAPSNNLMGMFFDDYIQGQNVPSY